MFVAVVEDPGDRIALDVQARQELSSTPGSGRVRQTHQTRLVLRG
jgi:hypothetical protein